MKILPWVFTFIMVFTKLQAQDFNSLSTGWSVDYDGNLIEEYFDFFNPPQFMEKTVTLGTDFTPGHYYDLMGKRIEGFIQFTQSNTYFHFKKNLVSEDFIIKPDNCNGFVIGTDSFAVIKNFKVERLILQSTSTKREFAMVVEKVNNITFYKHTRAGSQNIITTYLVQFNGDTAFYSFSQEITQFHKTAEKVFKDYPVVLNRILKGEFKSDDIPVVAKLIKYSNCFYNHKRVFFNKENEETDDSTQFEYYARMNSISGNNFNISYYNKNNQKLSEGNYTSLYPHKLTGNYFTFYPNGAIHKQTNFEKNELRNEILYYPNGVKHWEYKKILDKILYTEVLDSMGNKVLDEKGDGIHTCFDSLNNRRVVFEFSKSKLTKVYYFAETGQRIFLISDLKPKVRRMQYFTDTFNDEVEYLTHLVDHNKQGIIVVKCIVEPSGLITNTRILNSFDDKQSRELLNYLNTTFEKSIKWNPAKVNGSVVTSEIVLIFKFKISSFSWYRQQYYYHNNFFMQQQMWNQPKFNVPPPPPRMNMPRF